MADGRETLAGFEPGPDEAKIHPQTDLEMADDVVEIGCGHSSLLARPDEVCEVIAAAASYAG